MTHTDKENRNQFNRGYMCALASIVKAHGLGTEIRDALGCNFLTVAQMRKAGVDEYDIEALRPIVNEILKRNKKANP